MKPSQGQAAGSEPPADAALGLLSRAARELADGGVPAELSPLGWERLQRARAQRAHAARVWAAGAAAAVLLLAAGVTGGKLWLGRARDISYRVEGAALGEGGYIHDVGASGATLRFSEGTKVELDGGARAGIVSSGPEGARLRLESGRAHFEVVHRPDARWSVDAGPFSIAVTGTIFDVKWVGADEVLEVSLLRGAVVVRGPLAGDGVTLRPGQRLVSHLRDRQFRVEEMAPPPPRAPATSAAAEPPPVEPAFSPAFLPSSSPSPSSVRTDAAYHRLIADLLEGPQRRISVAPPRSRVAVAGEARPAFEARAGAPSSPSTSPSPSPSPPPSPSPVPAPTVTPPALSPPAVVPEPPSAAPSGWSKRMAKGDFRGVLRDAEQYGIATCVSDCDLSALSALADAARYAGSSEVARRALLAERKRFAQSAPAQAAAFLLGRMDEENALTTRDALVWYDHYLEEAPDGAYAPEALGRKMLVVKRLGDRAAAGRIAVEYRRRFPNGSYISQATMLLKDP